MKSPKFYLVTLKCNKNAYTSREELYAEYQILVKKLKKVEWGSNVSYELDSNRRWHLHTYCQSNGTPYFNRVKKTGWHIHLQEFPFEDLPNVIKYIMKTSQNKYLLDELDWDSRAAYQYLFTD